MERKAKIGIGFVAALALLGVAASILERRAVVEAAGVQAPRFEVDVMWPKPLPNHWVMGNVIGVSVDDKDHIWIVHRQGSLEAMENYAVANPPGPKRRAGVVEAECCAPGAGPKTPKKAATYGPIPITESRWITRAMSGSAGTAAMPLPPPKKAG